jgi:curved DNA-binding protein CbpA
MKLDSKYFDSVRVKPDQERSVREEAPACQWKGCLAAGLYRAPKGRGQEGQYLLLCLDHVREFNASYNYFDGWSSAEVEAFQKNSVVGHRPTWKSGANLPPGRDAGQSSARTQPFARPFGDSHAFFAWRSGRPSGEEPRRRLKPLEAKSLEALDLAATADKAEIKARFKELVKRHHPDANGGDKRSENKLREIIQAYNYLKQAGLV